MRDAFGGAFMVKVFLVFVLIYIIFTSLALNYAKAFKVKNAVVEYLESNEVNDLSLADYREKMQSFFDEEIVGNLNYNADITCPKNNSKEYFCDPIGIMIRKTGESSITGGVYYTVSTYIKWDLDFLKMFIKLDTNNSDPTEVEGTWKISGQTRLIVKE